MWLLRWWFQCPLVPSVAGGIQECMSLCLTPRLPSCNCLLFSFTSPAMNQRKDEGSCSAEGMDMGQARNASLDARRYIRIVIPVILLSWCQSRSSQRMEKAKPQELKMTLVWFFDATRITGSRSFTLRGWKERKGDWGSPETCFCMVKWPARACTHLPFNSQSWVRRSSFPRERDQGPASLHKRQSGKKMDKCHRNLKDVLLGYV